MCIPKRHDERMMIDTERLVELLLVLRRLQAAEPRFRKFDVNCARWISCLEHRAGQTKRWNITAVATSMGVRPRASSMHCCGVATPHYLDMARHSSEDKEHVSSSPCCTSYICSGRSQQPQHSCHPSYSAQYRTHVLPIIAITFHNGTSESDTHHILRCISLRCSPNGTGTVSECGMVG